MSIDFNKVPKYIRNELEKGSKIIQAPDKGRRVLRVQEWLRYHECRTNIDGDYGPATVTCVKDFQKKKRLNVSGKVDTKTWDALVEPMRLSLQPPKNIAALTPQKTIRKVAEQHLKHHPIEIGGDNRGPWVRLYCKGNDGRQWAWCAGFVSLIMHQAYFYREKKAPIEGTVSCDTLAGQAKEAGLFVAKSDITRSKVAWEEFDGCCIFLKRRTSTDWVHAGFALDANGPANKLVFSTIEGNTNDEGSREGYEACQKTRGLARTNYDFIKLA